MPLPPFTANDFDEVIKHLCDADNVFDHREKSKHYEFIQRLVALLYDWCDEEKKQL
ncbi:MAG: hypothetical protein GKR88_18045 [Flavobacteriaceae bacterium]|nr:MAG: hypothetical protein GKR88_02135 [Flavobacteriaceae bacterium]QMU65991.1 MAG: hypothetical protein GKR88_18045 [Flavobacteriaceae bacterium]